LLLVLLALINGLCSALEDIERQSLELLGKGTVARFMDKAGDSGMVAGLIERLREAITNYQVSKNRPVSSSATNAIGQISQQQAIYDRITNLTVSICRVSCTSP